MNWCSKTEKLAKEFAVRKGWQNIIEPSQSEPLKPFRNIDFALKNKIKFSSPKSFSKIQKFKKKTFKPKSATVQP